ncbi:hypothetical protein MHYP_G00199420 [Metynnis hypsauchen]
MDMKVQTEEPGSPNRGALSPEQPEASSSFTEPTSHSNERDRVVDNKEPGPQLQSFQEAQAEDPASDTSVFSKCRSRFRLPKLSFKKWRKSTD